MKTCVLVDIDDTLSASWRREALIEEGWDAYHADCHNDSPNVDVVHLVNGLHLLGLKAVGLSSRPNKYRPLTVYWLAHHGIALDVVLMRPDLDFRPSPILKIDLAAQFFGGKENIAKEVAFIIDDRRDVLQAFSALGVTTFEINVSRTAQTQATDQDPHTGLDDTASG